MANVPLSFFPLHASKKLSTPFKGLSEAVQSIFPNYEVNLRESDLFLTKDEFFAISIMNTFIWWLILSGLLAVIFNLLAIRNPIITAGIVGLVLAIMVFARITLGVKLMAQRKAKSIDSNLVFGLKMLLVEVNAGVSLFDAIVLVASYKLGNMSAVFKEIAKRLGSGEKEDEVLTDVAAKNPSPFLKKTLWQIVSGMRAGSPIGKVLQESLDALEREQKSEIIEYGSSLRVLTLVFMMLGVIIPAMAVAFLVVINSLPGVSISKEVPWIVIIGVAVFELMLIGFVKSKRPNLMGSV
jgi:flagellar protein FlaJ